LASAWLAGSVAASTRNTKRAWHGGPAGHARVGQMVDVSLVAVSAANWRACAALRVEEDQRQWVADVTYYLCLCTYGDT